mgnify:CR=1 FL=1
MGSASFTIGAANGCADASRLSALERGASMLLRSHAQFAALLGKEAPQSRAAREFATLCVRKLKEVRLRANAA